MKISLSMKNFCDVQLDDMNFAKHKISHFFRGRKLNSHLERAIHKAMMELDKQSKANKNGGDKKTANSSNKSPKTKLVKIAPAPDKKWEL